MPGARANGLGNEWEHLLATLQKYEITTKLRVAAFLANVAKESGELFYVEEIADGWDYEGREDLGNTEPGDGPRYKGHGYIQTTGRANHRAVGVALGIDAERDPEILTRMPYAWHSAGWYWRYRSSWGNLNDYADEGDFGSTVMGVRGGPDPDRWHYWFTALEVLPDDLLEEGGNVAQRLARVDDKGWLYDQQTGAWIKAPYDTNEAFASNKDGWLYASTTWSWPIGDKQPGWIGNGSYVDLHPSRWGETWRWDVEEVARYLVDNYDVSVNTYLYHPPSLNLDSTSFDVWGPAGRGDPLDPVVGQAVYNDLWHNGKPPWVRYYIYQGWIWVDGQGWSWYSNDDAPDSDAGHFGHQHWSVH
jgi:predicted chitinase